jgi:hypothetical protein
MTFADGMVLGCECSNPGCDRNQAAADLFAAEMRIPVQLHRTFAEMLGECDPLCRCAQAALNAKFGALHHGAPRRRLLCMVSGARPFQCESFAACILALSFCHQVHCVLLVFVFKHKQIVSRVGPRIQTCMVGCSDLKNLIQKCIFWCFF